MKKAGEQIYYIIFYVFSEIQIIYQFIISILLQGPLLMFVKTISKISDCMYVIQSC